ncbi:MAG: extracellular solute-binding protein, partial [Chitinophagales bacterium]
TTQLKQTYEDLFLEFNASQTVYRIQLETMTSYEEVIYETEARTGKHRNGGIIIANSAKIDYLIAENMIAPLSAFSSTTKIKHTIKPAYLNSMETIEMEYALPFLRCPFVLYYNESLITKLPEYEKGFETPKSWNELLQLMILCQNNLTNISSAMAVPNYMGDYGFSEILGDCESNVEDLKHFSKEVKNLELIEVSTKWKSAIADFCTNKAPIALFSGEGINYLENYCESEIVWSGRQLPLTGSSFVGNESDCFQSANLFISNHMSPEEKKVVSEFLEFLYSTEIQEKIISRSSCGISILK